jgi:hypothetical protein
MVLASIGVGIWFGLKNDCKDGYGGNLCENCLLFYLLF